MVIDFLATLVSSSILHPCESLTQSFVVSNYHSLEACKLVSSNLGQSADTSAYLASQDAIEMMFVSE